MIAFKYRACIEKDGKCRDIDMLLADQLYASPISQLNDCFEGSYADNVDRQLDEIAATYHCDVTKVRSRWEDLKRSVESVGVYSMALPDETFPNNKLLWSLYAGKYNGFCIAYDIDRLVQNEQFPLLVNRVTVDYQEKVPTIDVTDFSNETVLLQKMLGTKGTDWEREREFRLVYDKPGVKTYAKSALKALYLGFNMSDAHKQRIIEGLQGRNVDIFEMTKPKDSYDFIPDLKFSLRRKIENALTDEEYEIIGTNHKPRVENFYVLYKGVDVSDERLLAFVKRFREMHATMDANVELYDSAVVKPLLKKYPLNDQETRVMKDHSIGMSTFDAPDFFWKDVFD
jgi:hypothetical protein